VRGVARHVRILLGARWRALRNRFDRTRSRYGPLLAVGLAVAAALLVGLGHLSAPSLLESPAEVASGSSFGDSDGHAAGASALEAAFWLALLAAAITSFRVMEILYRRRDLRAVEAYPIRLEALYVDRFLAAGTESMLAGAALSLFFLPLVWHGAPHVYGLSLLVLFGGLVASAAFSFGLQVYAGRLNVRASENGGESRSVGAYGGPGQLFMFSPGVALAASAVSILLVRLAVGELLAPDGVHRAFWFAFGLLGAAVSASLFVAYRKFVEAYPAMCARFREADAVSYDPPVDYQVSDYASGAPLEGLLPGLARAPFRTDSLQYGRGYSLVRYSYIIGWLLGGLALAQWSRAAFPPWAVAAAPALVAATAANPWFRTARPPLRPAFARSLPLDSVDETVAALCLAARELLLMSLPYALLVVWADWSQAGPAGALLRGGGAVVAPLGLNGAVAVSWQFVEPSTWNAFLVPIGAAIAFLVAAVVSLPAAVTAAGLATLASAAPLFAAKHRAPADVR